MSRTLVLCFDGTSNEYSSKNTNVVKFVSLLKKDDYEKQLVYYQAGIGTFFGPGVVNSVFQWAAKILDEAIAWYLGAHIMDGYRFLMQNYRTGDNICLFGFSRGAYTARALAGMLNKVGLLGKGNDEQVIFAYKLYKRTDAAGNTLSAGFKQTFSRDVNISFVGAWDTVASVGVVMGKSLPFVVSNTAITTFRQALSLDERRARYRPNLYHRLPPTADPNTSASSNGKKKQKYFVRDSKRGEGMDTPASDEEAINHSKVQANMEVGTQTDVLEVWFCGAHSDVGGGNDADSVKHSLSDITLRWMVREVMTSPCGILFDDEALARNSIPNSPKSPPSEIKDDEVDAVQPIHDKLKLLPIWWILEIIPLHYMWQDGEGVWHTSYGWHLGRGRVICDTNPKFHCQRTHEHGFTQVYTKGKVDQRLRDLCPIVTWHSISAHHFDIINLITRAYV